MHQCRAKRLNLLLAEVRRLRESLQELQSERGGQDLIGLIPVNFRLYTVAARTAERVQCAVCLRMRFCVHYAG